MIKRDSYGIICQHNPLDPSYLDGGDSARAEGMMGLSGSKQSALNLPKFELGMTGLLRRHPYQSPYDDFRSFTRDQLLQYSAGAWACGHHDLMRRVFTRYRRKWFVCYNTHTLMLEKKKWWERDPLSPSHIGTLIKAGKIYLLYPALPFCWLWLLLDIFWSGVVARDDENNQVIAMCSVAGTWALWLYCSLNPRWEATLKNYWGKSKDSGFAVDQFRFQPEISMAIIKYVKGRLAKTH